MPDYPHKLLINPQGIVNHFDAARGFEEKDEEEDEEQPEKNYTIQKATLRRALFEYGQDVADKYVSRTIIPVFSINYIRIDFLVTFANTIEYNTKDTFEKQYGLHPIRFYNFNKTVLFEIADVTKFEKLQELLVEFIDSPDSVSPQGHTYNIVTLIQDFHLLTANELFNEALGNSTGSVALQLTHQTESPYRQEKNALQKQLNTYIQQMAATNPDVSYKFEDRWLLINGTTVDELQNILKNFDLVASAQSIRIPRTITGRHSPNARTYDFNIVGGSTSLPKVVIIDTGISQATPLSALLGAPAYTFDSAYPAYRPVNYHGTAVATITAVGEQFFDTANKALNAQCQLFAYRLFEDSGGTIDLIAFEENIRDAAANGVRLFNLSVNVAAKAYNDNYSFFAYLLDKLSYELDILFFISAGNLNGNDLNAIYNRMQRPGYAAMLDYPAHFFSPDEFCNEHNCEGTNLKVPAESLNNMTVGAIAENLNAGTQVDMSLDKTTPAYYTSKYHVSPFHKVNGARLKGKHINFRLYKPDIVFPGGDYGAESAGIQVSGTGIATDQYRQECGTSFSAPFATNLAAQISHKYPTINVQSIKALIINSATPTAQSGFLESHLNRLRDKFAFSEFGKSVAALTRPEKLKINKWFHTEDMLKRLAGHGQPDRIRALSSDNKSITVILEDSIGLDKHKAIPIHLPKYLNAFAKNTTLVNVEATLCYKFLPDFYEQMGYNPLHISFNFIKTFADPVYTAKVAAYRADDLADMNFYTPLYQGIVDPTEKNKQRKIALGVKANLETWSDDFYPNIRQFSNTQKLRLKINIHDLAKTGNEISLIVRCTGKSDAPYEVKNYLNGQHQFSIVLTFSEEGKRTFAGIDFYEKFTDINQTADIVATLDTEADGLDVEL
jgi:hypothetical protein